MEEIVCAKCTGSLKELRIGSFTLERCDHCRGLFFEAGELARVLTDGGREPGDAVPDAASDAQPATCPRCQIEMDRLPAGSEGRFHYDQCPACRSLWLDAGEFSHLEHANLAQAPDAGKDAETRRRRAASVVEQLEGLLGEIERRREDRLKRLDKLMTYGLTDAAEIRSIRSAIEAEAQLGRESLSHSRLFEEAHRLCIQGLISGAQFEGLRQRVG